MEISQYTYFQQVGGLDVRPVSGEMTYGLERLALYVQGVDNVFDLAFNDPQSPDFMTYGEVFLENEREFSAFEQEAADVDMLRRQFVDMERAVRAAPGRARTPGPASGSAGLRPCAEGLAPVQSAGFARGHRGGRAAELHRPHPRAVQGLRPGLGGRWKQAGA